MDEYGWNNGVADYPTLFSGIDMAYYVDSIQKAVKQRSSDDGGNLMLYFDEERNPNVKAKTLSAIPSVEIRGDELKGCTTVRLKEPLTGPENAGFAGLSQGPVFRWLGRRLRAAGNPNQRRCAVCTLCRKTLDFEVEQVQSTEVSKEQPVPKRPKMKLVGEDGNIFAI